MRKYKKAIRKILHTFNWAKRNHHNRLARELTDSMHGITRVAMEDEQVTSADFVKMLNIHDAMHIRLQKI